MKRSAVRFHADAEVEVLEAHKYYWLRSEAAADAFLLELELALDLIAEGPERWPLHAYGTRRLVLPNFPFLVIYRNQPEGLQVVAVAHARRRPSYWKKRLR